MATGDRAPVTIIGLGPMGQALAGAYVAAGHPTTVWNRTPGKADDLVARGAVRAATAAEAVAASPLVIVCLLDYDAAHAVLDPIAGALKGRTLVQLTADTPGRARRSAEWAAAHGIDYLDGAIMTPTTTIGGPSAVLLYSGPADVYQAHKPVLDVLGGTATHLGTDPGRAAAYDLALLDLFWTSMSGLMHAFALARAEGITAKDFAPFAAGIGHLMPIMIDTAVEPVDSRHHPSEGSAITSNAATLDHIIHAGEERGIDVSVVRAIKASTQRAIDAGHGGDAFSRLVEVFSEQGA
ncbi:NAD(P)-dependent oxidoreductase [Spongiactinospora rosea]|uniref:NAD(P)-dependent oxidoreductase n=1 Tax=Spongiactinospora rosea TaxID=2248750 RepID=A0A366LKP2_9ACTN|nr:NAD(P)-binding domain-containing protein [Spongiactinospora rosea]RBQ14053.1 NAD(P)-dependent oxidoreductase [Spongiactinospora rosea]